MSKRPPAQQVVSAEYPLYKTEEEVAALVGVGIDKWRGIAHVLEREGLPKRDLLLANRRYWPAVRAFLDKREGLSRDDASGIRVDVRQLENWDPPPPRRKAK